MTIQTNVSTYKTSANYLSDKTPPRCVSDAVEELYRFKNSHFDLMTGYGNFVAVEVGAAQRFDEDAVVGASGLDADCRSRNQSRSWNWKRHLPMGWLTGWLRLECR